MSPVSCATYVAMVMDLRDPGTGLVSPDEGQFLSLPG